MLTKILIKLFNLETTLTELCLLIPLNISHDGAADNAAINATVIYSIFYQFLQKK